MGPQCDFFNAHAMRFCGIKQFVVAPHMRKMHTTIFKTSKELYVYFDMPVRTDF